MRAGILLLALAGALGAQDARARATALETELAEKGPEESRLATLDELSGLYRERKDRPQLRRTLERILREDLKANRRAEIEKSLETK